MKPTMLAIMDAAELKLCRKVAGLQSVLLYLPPAAREVLVVRQREAVDRLVALRSWRAVRRLHTAMAAARKAAAGGVQ